MNEVGGLSGASSDRDHLLEKIAARLPGVVYQYRLRPDGSSCFPFASAALQQIYGVSPAEVQQDAAVVFSRLHPEDLEAVRESILRSARELSPWRHEYRVRLDDGTERWLRGDANPEREADGSVLWHGFITDVTDQRRAVEALRQSEERFAQAMEATSDGLWDWDVTTDQGYFSPGYYRMLGHDVGAFPATGAAWRALVHPEDLPAAERANLDCIEGRCERFEVEFRLRHRGGGWRWILGRGKCAGRDATGRALRLLGTHVDITERKRLESHVAQSDRLVSMGLLAAGVAHEINNPLAYVMVNLETLAEVIAAPDVLAPSVRAEVVELTEGALEGIRRIRTVSVGLSTFSRVERSEPSLVDVNRVLEMAATMTNNELRHRATLVKALGPVPPVRATEGKLCQVLVNLLINAAHAIDEGDAENQRITVRTGTRGQAVFVEVTDTGHGIAPEHLERIFDPFFSTGSRRVGAGLGLAISKALVAEFGGSLGVESEVGRGSRFVVQLPAAPAEVQARPPALAPPPAQAEATATPAAANPGSPRPAEEGRGGRVLVVDDETAIRRAVARLLGARYQVVVAASGLEAKGVLEKDGAFDVILCDLMMPEMTGMDLHAWLVGHAPALARRVVFMSGGAFTPNASEYLSRVGNPSLEKPFERETLLRAVAGAMRAA